MAHDASRRKEEDVTQTPSSSLPRHRPHGSVYYYWEKTVAQRQHPHLLPWQQ